MGLQHVVRAGYDATQRGKLLERQQRDLEEEGLDGDCWTRYRDLEKRREFWHKLPDNRAEGTEPRIARRETFLAHEHGVILDAALVDERRGRFALSENMPVIVYIYDDCHLTIPYNTADVIGNKTVY